MTIARRVVVHGRVQGVFFRESARRRARRAGVAGWVQNNDDGSVEAWFEGEPDDVEVMLHFAETGPSGAYSTSSRGSARVRRRGVARARTARPRHGGGWADRSRDSPSDRANAC